MPAHAIALTARAHRWGGDGAMNRAALWLAGLCLVPPGPAATSPGTPAIPVGPERQGYWGFALGLYPAEAARRGFGFPPGLGEVAQLGASHVLVPVSWTQSDVRSADLAPDAETLSDGQLLEVIDEAHTQGLRALLMPQVRLRHASAQQWRGVLRPRDRAAWWRTYRAFVLPYAELARRAGVAMLVIGSELSSMSSVADGPHWAELSKAARAAYPGPLAYGANHDALDLSTPFEHVDVIGVSAYFPLGSRSPQDWARFERRWRRIGERLRALRRQAGKPLVLLEVGYPSQAGAAATPWNYTSSAPIDLEEQRAAYAALVSVAAQARWLDGVLFWHWFGPGGEHDRWYTPRGKPALVEVSRLFQARARRQRGP